MRRRTFLSASLAALSTPFGLWKMQRRPKLPEMVRYDLGHAEKVAALEPVQWIRFTLTENLEYPLWAPSQDCLATPVKALSGDFGQKPDSVTVWDASNVFYGRPGACGLAAWHKGRYEIRWLELQEPEPLSLERPQHRRRLA